MKSKDNPTEEIDAISPRKVFINGRALTEHDALDAVDEVLKDFNIRNADTAIDTLLGLQHISGKALAKLLHGLKENWKDEDNDPFFDHMDMRHKINKTVAERYILVWEMMSTKQIPASVQVRPMRDQIPIAKALEQGYEFKDTDWQKIQKAAHNFEILDIVRKVKGKAPRKSSMQLRLERDGTINLWKNNERKFVGYFDVKSEDEDVKKAIARFLGIGVKKA